MKVAVLFPEGVKADRSPSDNNKRRRDKAFALYQADVVNFIFCVGGSRMQVLEDEESYSSMAAANAFWLRKRIPSVNNVEFRSLSMKTTDNLRLDAVSFIKENDPEQIYLVSGALHLARIWWSAIWLLGPRYWRRLRLCSSGWEENSPFKLAKELFCLALTIPDPWGIWLWRAPGLFRKRRRLATGR